MIRTKHFKLYKFKSISLNVNLQLYKRVLCIFILMGFLHKNVARFLFLSINKIKNFLLFFKMIDFSFSY